MSFLAGERLWLLLAVAAVAVAWVVVQRRRPAVAVRFAELDLLASVAPRRSGWRRWAPPVAVLVLLLASVVAWARPTSVTRVPRDRATVVVALDVSNSMAATDVSPSRLAAAKSAAVAFIGRLPARLRVGLVAFDRTATVVQAPTEDHAAVQQAVRDLQLGPGTAIGDAVEAALSAAGDQPGAAAGGDALPGAPTPGASPSPAAKVPARIVLLSDGTSQQGVAVPSAAADAKAAGVPVSTIAYGTPDGTVEIQGQVIPVPADVEALRELAQDSGGTAYQAQSAGQLDAVYRDIGTQVGTVEQRTEVTSWFAGLAVLAGLVAAVTGLLWTPRLP